MRFKDNILQYLIILFVIILTSILYFRFIVFHDYVVGYNGACDPTTGKCFESCNDDACSEKSYYSKIQKYEPDIKKECGEDITNCAQANICLSTDRYCSITYCNENSSDKNNVCQTSTSSINDSNL